MSKGYDRCMPGHGLNRNNSSTQKKGGNKGIAAAHKERKRREAEERNARTLPENRRKYRREMLADAA